MNDAKNVRDFLIRVFDPILPELHLPRLAGHHGFKPKNVILLTDESQDPRHHPTRKNMMDSMYWLVQDAKMDDSLFFHCMGSLIFERM